MDRGSNGNQIQGGKKILLICGSVTWGACTVWNNQAAGRSQCTTGRTGKGKAQHFHRICLSCCRSKNAILPVHIQSKENSYSVKAGLSSLLLQPQHERRTNQADWILLTFSTLDPAQGRNNKHHCGQTINVILMSLCNLKSIKPPLKNTLLWPKCVPILSSSSSSLFNKGKKRLHSRLLKMC